MRLLTVLMLSVLVAACSGLSLLNAVTSDRGYEAAANIAYAVGEGRRLDIYAPKNLDQRAPVVVFFHGGRWTEGNKDEYKFVGEALSSRGIVAVVADYRKYPDVRMAGFMDDAAKAVSWVHSNISSYGGDPQKLFVMGHSSGAHMATLLALDRRYLDNAGMRTPLAGAIGLAGAYDFLPLRAPDLQEIFGPESRYSMSQPVNFARPEAPPTLLVHSKDDATTSVSNARNLAQALRDKGAPVTTVYYDAIRCSPGVSSHACTVAVLARPFRTTIDLLDQIVRFVEKHAGTPEQTPSTPAPVERSRPRALGDDNVELKE